MKFTQVCMEGRRRDWVGTGSGELPKPNFQSYFKIGFYLKENSIASDYSYKK